MEHLFLSPKLAASINLWQVPCQFRNFRLHKLSMSYFCGMDAIKNSTNNILKDIYWSLASRLKKN